MLCLAASTEINTLTGLEKKTDTLHFVGDHEKPFLQNTNEFFDHILEISQNLLRAETLRDTKSRYRERKRQCETGILQQKAGEARKSIN